MNGVFEPAVAIPADLRAKLDALRGVLELQGVVQPHHGANRKPAIRVRYRIAADTGEIIHRSVPLGNDANVAAAVGELIAGWRAERAAKVAAVQREDETRKLTAQKEQLLCKTLQEIAGGGRRRRRQVREWVDTIRENPMESWRFILTGRLPDPRKPGRPHKARLW